MERFQRLVPVHGVSRWLVTFRSAKKRVPRSERQAAVLVFQACVAMLAEVINALEKLGSLVLLFKLFLIHNFNVHDNKSSTLVRPFTID